MKFILTTTNKVTTAMKYNYELEVGVRQVIKITVVISSTATTSSENESDTQSPNPEVAKRDKQVIPVLPVEQDDEDDEEESEEEYDEFEEEIVVMDVRRKPMWRKGLEIPKPQPEKVGIPIEDLLEIPTLEAKQESVPDALLIDEKIEFLERPPVVHAEIQDFLENL